MKHILLAFVVLLAAGAAAAGEGGGVKVSGYMAPNLRLIDKGEGASSNLGFGMAFNRFTLSGEMDAGSVVKSVTWVVEADVSQPAGIALQWAYVEPTFSDALSLRFGNVKKPFSREVLHATGKLLTVDRSPACGAIRGLGYADYNYGLEMHLALPRFKVQAGAYAGTPPVKDVSDQDPGIDLGARVVFKATPCLEIGANALMIALPEGGNNGGEYLDDAESNSGMAFGFDLGLNRDFGGKNLQALIEFGTGDSWQEGAESGDSWEDYSWYKFQYYTAKLLFRFTPALGVHFGYAAFDPNTDVENDGSAVMTPGVTYFWSKTLRTQVEAQLVSYENEDREGLTHFVLQQVFLW